VSDMTLSEAQAEAAKWGSLIRALSRLQEAAETLGALEQNRAERQHEVDRLGDEIVTAGEHLAELHDRIAQAEERCTAMLDEAHTQASDLITAAQTEAQQILAQAQAQAKRAEADAKAARAEVEAAQSLRAEAEEAAAQAEGRLVAARAAARAVIEE